MSCWPLIVVSARISVRRREAASGGRIAVFAPSPLLTVTIEAGTDRPEVHLHAGGQGFWVARLAATLGAEVVLCCALGGEPGRIVRALIEAEPLTLRAADAGTPNGVYVHDRRSGKRVEIVSVDARPLARHAADELYGIALGAGLDAEVTLVTGCQPATSSMQSSIDGWSAICVRTGGRDRRLDRPAVAGHARGRRRVLRLSEQELVWDNYAATTLLRRSSREHTGCMRPAPGTCSSRAGPRACRADRRRRGPGADRACAARCSRRSTSGARATRCSPPPASASHGG